MVGWSRRLKEGLLISSITVILMLVVGEVVVRALRPESFDLHVRCSLVYNHTYTPNHREGSVGPEGYVTTESINSLGLFQGREVLVPKPRGTYRIIVIGDSFVAGLRPPYAVSYILEDALRKHAPAGIEFEVINGGQSSYSPLLYLARLKHQFLSLQPDAVLLLPDLTDVFDDNHRYRPFAEYDPDGNLVSVGAGRELCDHENALRRWGFYATDSYLARYAIRRFVDTTYHSPPDPYETYPNENPLDYIFVHARDDDAHPSRVTQSEVAFSAEAVAAFVDETKRAGVHIALLSYPHLEQIVPERTIRGGNHPDRLWNRLFERALQQVAESRHVAFRSFYEEIASQVRAGNSLYFKGDPHFNEAGQLALGRLVADWAIQNPQVAIGIGFEPVY